MLSDPRAAVYSWPSLTKRRTKLVIMRNFFLMCSQSRWLREHAAKHRFVRRAVSRFMPGETVSDALAAAVALRGGSIGSVFTRLGENVTDANEAEEVTTHYLEVLERIDRKSTRLNSSHVAISYAVFCLKKKKKQ